MMQNQLIAIQPRRNRGAAQPDSGDILDTTTHTFATYMEYLANCRHGFVEMDWKNGHIVDTTTHVGLGY